MIYTRLKTEITKHQRGSGEHLWASILVTLIRDQHLIIKIGALFPPNVSRYNKQQKAMT